MQQISTTERGCSTDPSSYAANTQAGEGESTEKATMSQERGKEEICTRTGDGAKREAKERSVPLPRRWSRERGEGDRSDGGSERGEAVSGGSDRGEWGAREVTLTTPALYGWLALCGP